MGKKAIAGGLSLLGGAGIGAALLYLFDPEKGAQRRSSISSAAGSAVQGAGGTFSKAWHEVASHAGDLKERLTEHASHLVDHAKNLTDHARDLKDQVSDSAGSSASDLSDRIQKKAREYADSAREYAASYLQPESQGGSATGYTLTAAGALALGLGAMYLLDPNKGKDRRDALFTTVHNTLDEAASAARTAGNFVRKQVDRAMSEVTAHTDQPLDEAAGNELKNLHWTPVTRLAVGITGGALGFYGAVRRDWVGIGAGAVGLGLIAAGLAKYDFSQISRAAQQVKDAATDLGHPEEGTEEHPTVAQEPGLSSGSGQTAEGSTIGGSFEQP